MSSFTTPPRESSRSAVHVLTKMLVSQNHTKAKFACAELGVIFIVLNCSKKRRITLIIKQSEYFVTDARFNAYNSNKTVGKCKLKLINE